MSAAFLAPKLLSADQPVVRLAMFHAPEYANALRAAEMSAREVQRAASLLKREFHFEGVPHDRGASAGEWTGLILAAAGNFAGAQPRADITGTRCGDGVLALRPIRDKCGTHRCALWHSSLERFGAGQLNDRFRAAGITIDEQAWLGWLAVKLLWEAGTRGVHPARLQYDGHKGMALHFNSAGVLVQPYYLLSADGATVIEEVRSGEALEQMACAS